MAALVTPEQVGARLGRSYTDPETIRVEALIADVSAAVRSYTGQQILEATTTDRLRVHRGTVRLPQRPVTAVSAVEDIDGNASDYTWDGLDRLNYVGTGTLNRFDYDYFRLTPAVVDVTYTHGYDTTPDDLVGVVSQIVIRALSVDIDRSAIQQETIAGYSYSLGGAAGAGAYGLLLGERQILDRYRRTGSVVWQS